MVIQTNKRTEILFNLISIFEGQQLNKFKIYVSKHISIKQVLDGTQAGAATFKKEKSQSVEAQGQIELDSPDQQAEAESPAQIVEQADDILQIADSPSADEPPTSDNILAQKQPSDTQDQPDADSPSKVQIQDGYLKPTNQDIQLEADEPGGITDQEIIDQFKSYERAGTFAVAKDELRERIVNTLNVYNDTREKASKADPSFVSKVI